jgi:hypothetical protein
MAALVLTSLAWPAWFWREYSSFEGLGYVEIAERLVRYHHVRCQPSAVVRREGLLEVACDDGGTVTFFALLQCEAGFACATLEFAAACWVPSPGP